jgi:2',3'-cyclic-nucleotide 2'-phosphodiesterase (5'-nucleotidase family)
MLESTADNLLLKAMLAATGVELAFANGWRYGAPIPAGGITAGDLYNLAPMDPEISLVDLSGAEVWEMIEDNLERTFSRDPFRQMGGYVKRCAGMKTFFKAENPMGSRVQEIFVGTERIDKTRRYRAAYITIQAVPTQFGSNRKETGTHLIRAVMDYLVAGRPSAELHDSFVEI